MAVAGARQRLIVDTDMGFDVDDAMAVCLANTLHKNGLVELLAVVHDTGCQLGIGGVSALNHFYGHDNITLGAWKGEYGSNCFEHFNGALGQDQYLSKLINNPNLAGPIKNADQVMLGTDAYRKELAAAPDGSVHIASIGMPTNIADLLQTPPDKYSPLTGVELVAAKVAKVVFMDGMYNFGCADGLIGPALDCVGKAATAVKLMPPSVSMVFSGEGANPPIYTGQDLQTTHPWYSPCRAAIGNWCCDPNGKPGKVQGRLSWDPITVMIASLGVDAVYEQEVDKGTQVSVDQAGHESFFGNGTLNARTDFSVPTAQAPVLISKAINGYINQVPPPVAPTSSDGYVRGQGLNCWPGHGAQDIPTTGTPMTVAQCHALCDSTSGCTGVVTEPNAYKFNCYMKKDIDFAQCQTGTSFSTWVKATYVEAGGYNCYGPRNGQPAHGAVDLEHPPWASCGVMTVAACQAKCDSTVGCNGITTSDAGNGLINCFRKGDIDLSQCDHGTSFNTYKSADHW